jgi:propionyl-CoA carboxylase alpha chain
MHMRDLERAAQISGQLAGRSPAIGARWVVTVDGENFPVYVREREDGYDIGYDKGLLVMRSSWRPGRKLFQGTLNGKQISVQVRNLNEGYMLIFAGSEVPVVVRTPRVAELAQYVPEVTDIERQDQLKAPIAGLIVSVAVKECQAVKAGQDLLVIEAMKMENVLKAEIDGTVKKLHIRSRDSVANDQLLIEFDLDSKGK